MRLSALLSAARPRLPPGYRHGLWPPDSAAARLRNPPGQRRRKVFVEPVAEDDWKVFKGDTVQLLAGKDAGKQGTVTQVVRARNWVVVEGLNTERLQQGGLQGALGRLGGRVARRPLARTDGPKDTSEEDALAKTYRPSLKTFEEEVMDAMGIVETRRAKKSYWY
ncbi:RM24 protein, partial [Daphoenositta chrysoptera]|nr:RM24 protein [Daphoenositta chrysoptera]